MFAIQWTYVNGNEAYEQLGFTRYPAREAAVASMMQAMRCAKQNGVVGLHGIVVEAR